MTPKNNNALWALPISGFFYLLGVCIRGPFADPSSSAELFASRATSPTFAMAYLLIILASGIAILGYIALRDRLQTRLANAALALSIIGLHFLTAFFGLMAIAYPSIGRAFLSGDNAAGGLAAQFLASDATVVIMGTAGTNILGHALFAFALWKSDWAPRAFAVPFVLATIMMMIPFIYPVEIVGCALLLVSGAALAWSGTRAPGLARPQTQGVLHY